MNLRKVFAILLALLVVLSFAACDGGGGGSSSDNGGGSGGNGGGGETTVPAPLCFTAVDGDVEVGLLVTITKDFSSPALTKVDYAGLALPLAPPSLEWSSDKKKWTSIDFGELSEGENPVTIKTLAAGEKIYIRATDTNTSFLLYNSSGIIHTKFHFLGKGTVAASGNIMSLLDKTCALTEIPSNSCFYLLFALCENLTSAPELPATTLAEGCYANMFKQCTSLTAAPKLPATTLVKECYNAMFERCTSLTTAPALPATTLAEYCYGYMFNGCTNLTKAPELPATTLAPYCYSDMFNGCKSLETAPDLPAKTLVEGCYAGMFSGCSSLNSIEVSFEVWGTDGGTNGWLTGVAETGNLDGPSSLGLCLPSNSTIPSGWTFNGESLIED